ncbi:peptidase T [Exiguobacterium antarcticum]|uniref:peptidase T n=1 Tax=Exiguobacterium antarcticum TaxID=132920 RepID=UPI000285EFCD|nr:peptidase T [Exiguobacterium antarcticum]AFS71848.1 Peptidase T [Exiguobacterium antarcticum B7]
MKHDLIRRLTTYAKIDTQSSYASTTVPTTEGQWTLARLLVDELNDIGMSDVTVDENGYVMATLPANTDADVPTIGFLAHLDTATDFTGTNVNPQIVEDYDGEDLVLNATLPVILSPNDFPALKNYVGHTLMTTDGTTLLGADNKAGIAEIMTAMHHLITHPEIQHGRIRVAFTPDEEIGRGPHHFDVEAFDAKFAYTVDGGPLGELEYESFNAAAAKIIFHGTNVHPGTAKDKMVNSQKHAMAFQNRLPGEEAPEFTDGFEGFYHLISFEGSVEKTTVQYIIRDFDRAKFEARKHFLTALVEEWNKKYGAGSVELELNDQYYNMREKIEPHMEIVDIAHAAMESRSVTPLIKPIRGGTDGSQLSYMGLPTPNIFTGGENYHGKFEFISVDNMVKATEVVVAIAERFAQSAE